MAENSRSSRSRPVLPWSIQQIHENSHQIASSATQHIHELQDYVMQGLSPLINSSNLRSSVAVSNHGSWNSESNATHQRNIPPPSSGTDNSFVINMEDLMEPELQNTDGSDEPNGNTGNSGNSNYDEIEQNLNTLRNSPELKTLLKFTEMYLPFFLILFLKIAFDHRIGILVNIGLFITFFHANTVVKREVAKQGKRRLRSLFFVFLNLTSSIIVIYTFLADSNLAYALIFVPPYSAPIEVCEVLWIVTVTDFVLRLITILVKLIFVAIPGRLLAYQKKGKYYLFLERSSQMYRHIAPMQHWLYYFSESYSGPSKVFGVILSAAYLIFKAKSIMKKARLWKRSFVKVIQNKTYGVTPSSSEMKEAGDACPICQDDYKSPSKLQCKHIFCEECVALWFDRERTCPICRAQIADDPTFRDGATTLQQQFF